MKRYLAVDNVCGWPNLARDNNDRIIATVFNKPFHGSVNGEIECYISVDKGETWKYLSTPVYHEKNTNRMNVATGMLADGTFEIICGGWNNRSDIPKTFETSQRLTPVVCRSYDRGATWKSEELSYESNGIGSPITPYGNIIEMESGVIAAPFYTFFRQRRKTEADILTGSAYVFFSYDNGKTWPESSIIAENDYNETSILKLENGSLIAACRTYGDMRLDLFGSKDKGRTWTLVMPLTMSYCHPGHFLLLDNGKILLTYGNRTVGAYSICARIGDANGEKWSRPVLLAELSGATDGGYPSTVQLSDGTLVTAYYSNYDIHHNRFHVGACIWKFEDLVSKNKALRI